MKRGFLMSTRKKGCCGCLTALVAVFIVCGIIGTVFPSNDDEQDVSKAISADAQSQTDDAAPAADEAPTADQPEDSLLQTITATISDKYSDCDVQQDNNSVTVKVWDGSVASTFSTVQSSGGGANDAGWVSIKNGYLDTASQVKGLMQDAGQDMPLNLSVMNNRNQNLVMLTFSNTDLTYDILASETQSTAPAEEPTQPEQSSQPESTSQPEQEPQPVQPEQTPQPAQSGSSHGGGGGNNFNTYDNAEQQQTTDKYVLNTNSKVFHFPSCPTVKKIAPQNYATSNSSPEELKEDGYKACGRCNPW